MNYIDLKYCGILSSTLERFKVKNQAPYKANFRCPICGDSQKNAAKARGWLLEHNNTTFFYCHNCGESLPLSAFLRRIDGGLYNQYVVDVALEKGTSEPKQEETDDRELFKTKKIEFKPQTLNTEYLKKVSSLPHDHPVKIYVLNRRIPTDKHYLMWYAPKFNKFANSHLPKDRRLPTKNDEPRLVFPFYNISGKLIGFAGRSFNPKSEVKYMTIMLDEDEKKVYGLDRVDFTKPYYIVEGQIDSLFLPNAIAMAGADGNTMELPNPENQIIVFDNEPRNRDIVKRIDKVLKNGQKTVIWPSNLNEKDINDMVLSGLSPEDVRTMIDNHVFSGIDGTLALTIWKRI